MMAEYVTAGGALVLPNTSGPVPAHRHRQTVYNSLDSGSEGGYTDCEGGWVA